LVEGNLSNIETWLNEVSTKDPANAIELMLKLSEFILPKIKAIELTGKDGKDLMPEKKIDLSKLSNDDLRTLIGIQDKIGI